MFFMGGVGVFLVCFFWFFFRRDSNSVCFTVGLGTEMEGRREAGRKTGTDVTVVVPHTPLWVLLLSPALPGAARDFGSVTSPGAACLVLPIPLLEQTWALLPSLLLL